MSPLFDAWKELEDNERRTGEDIVLYRDKWMELRKKDNWYTYAHNTHGDGVAVLGFKKLVSKGILVRVEHTPAHGEGFRRTSLTGSIEHGLTPSQTAVKELKEESGYVAAEEELTYLGWVYPSKFSDYKQHLYAVDLSLKHQFPILGDGTEGEKGATVEWVTLEEALEINDPSIGATMIKLLHKEGHI